jgi:hypothetical protein
VLENEELAHVGCKLPDGFENRQCIRLAARGFRSRRRCRQWRLLRTSTPLEVESQAKREHFLSAHALQMTGVHAFAHERQEGE